MWGIESFANFGSLHSGAASVEVTGGLGHEDSNVCEAFIKEKRRISRRIENWVATYSHLWRLEQPILACRDFDVDVFNCDSNTYDKAANVICRLCNPPKMIRMQRTNHGNQRWSWNATDFYKHIRKVHNRQAFVEYPPNFYQDPFLFNPID